MTSVSYQRLPRPRPNQRQRLLAGCFRLGHPVAGVVVGALRYPLRATRVLVVRGDLVLLVRHTYGQTEQWSAPGGLRRRREAPQSAAAREVFEEVGLVTDVLHSLGIVSSDGRVRAMTEGYLAPQARGAVTLDPVELAEGAWFPLADLPLHIEPVTRALLERRKEVHE